jgi:hypothetical protein
MGGSPPGSAAHTPSAPTKGFTKAADKCEVEFVKALLRVWTMRDAGSYETRPTSSARLARKLARTRARPHSHTDCGGLW